MISANAATWALAASRCGQRARISCNLICGEPVQDAGPFHGLGQQLVQAGGVDKAAHGLDVQVQAAEMAAIDSPWARSSWIWA
jgi:hypothetical protein